MLGLSCACPLFYYFDFAGFFWSLTDDINEPSYFDSIFVISNHRRVMEVYVIIITDFFFAVQHAVMKQSHVLIE